MTTPTSSPEPSESHPRSRLSRLEWLAVVAILLGAFALRIAAFASAPPGVIHDEVRSWLNAQLVEQGDLRALYPYGGGREALHMLLSAASYTLIGDNLLAGRFPSIAFGLFTIAASYSLARRWFGRWAGLFAAAALAVSFWNLMFARLAERPISLPGMALVTVLVYAHLLEHKPHALLPYAGAGLLLGLTLYTYPAALIFPVVLGAWIGLRALSGELGLRAVWLRLALSVALAGLLAIPLVLAWNDPAATSRANEVSMPLQALRGGDPGPVLANVLPVLGMFSVAGDHGLEFNVQDQPVFPTIPLAMLFYVGVAWSGAALFSRKGRRNPGYGLLVLWLLLMLVPTLVTDRPVNPYRTIGLLGVVYFFPAVALGRALERERRGAGRWLIALAAGGALLLELDHTLTRYFTTWAANPVVTFLYQQEYRDIAPQLDALPAGAPLTIGGLTPQQLDPASMRLLMVDDVRASGAGYFDPQTALLIPGGEAPGCVVLPGFVTLHPALSARLDQWGYRADAFPLAPACASLDRAQIASGVELARFFEGETERAILLRLDAPPGFTPGALVTMLTVWRTEAPSDVPLRIFLHLTDASGNIVAQSDVLGVPSTQWRMGDVFVQAHDLSLLAEAPPGPYSVNIGLYAPESGIRLVVSGEGSQGDALRYPLNEP
ncbi:MAG: glycosyltransferase family 39 protein [Anaerolineae bacterium]|nr:glycosyltransferase family 39 protein [Anaerolineae bacterium]